MGWVTPSDPSLLPPSGPPWGIKGVLLLYLKTNTPLLHARDLTRPRPQGPGELLPSTISALPCTSRFDCRFARYERLSSFRFYHWSASIRLRIQDLVPARQRFLFCPSPVFDCALLPSESEHEVRWFCCFRCGHWSSGGRCAPLSGCRPHIHSL